MIGRFALVCLDMAGTTVRDDGAVDAAFSRAFETVRITRDAPRYAEARRFVHETMGWSKSDVFAALLPPRDAARATTAFAAAYEAFISAGEVYPMEGAAAVLHTLRERDTRICLTTGFAPSTRDALLTTLGWTALVDCALSPADVGGRGRPAPDLILRAMAQLGVADPAAVAVVGDTVSDLEAGTAAHAGAVIGVLSGAHDQATLGRTPHTALLPDIGHLIKELERAA
jgi:phosphonatase-like hydrolase